MAKGQNAKKEVKKSPAKQKNAKTKSQKKAAKNSLL